LDAPSYIIHTDKDLLKGIRGYLRGSKVARAWS